MNKKICNIVLIISFLLLIIIPLIRTNRYQGKLLVFENRIAEPFPKIFDKDGRFLFEFDLFESWLNDNIGFREELVKLNSNINSFILSKSPIDLVYIGLDGWYFYTGNNNFSIASGDYKYSDDDMNTMLSKQVEINNNLRKKNIDYYVVIPPSKVSVYPEYIFPNHNIKVSPVDLLEEKFKKNDINFINFKDELIAAKKDKPVYYKTDTHWSPYGSYIGYKATRDIFLKDNIVDSDEFKINFKNDSFVGDMTKMLGNDSKNFEENFSQVDIVNTSVRNIPFDLFHLNGSGYILINENENLPELLIYGDSYMGTSPYGYFLAEHFSKVTFLWTNDIKESDIDEINPDVVIYSSTERFAFSMINTNYFE